MEPDAAPDPAAGGAMEKITALVALAVGAALILMAVDLLRPARPAPDPAPHD